MDAHDDEFNAAGLMLVMAESILKRIEAKTEESSEIMLTAEYRDVIKQMRLTAATGALTWANFVMDDEMFHPLETLASAAMLVGALMNEMIGAYDQYRYEIRDTTDVVPFWKWFESKTPEELGFEL